jgi:hypothetical protein
MNKKLVLSIVGILALTASIGMFVTGTTNDRLTELKQYWWIPLPLALICFVLANTTRQKPS